MKQIIFKKLTIFIALFLIFGSSVIANNIDEFEKIEKQEEKNVSANKQGNKRVALKSASSFPDTWSDFKNAKNITGMLIGKTPLTTEYSFTPIQYGNKAFGKFSWQSFGGCNRNQINEKIKRFSGKSIFTDFLKKYWDDDGDYTPRAEFDLRNCPDTSKGTIGVRYNNIGYYNGSVVDMKMTITNWSISNRSALNSKQAGVTLNKSFGIAGINLYSVGINYSFFKAGTNTPLKVKGYWSFNDIDGLQSVSTNKNNIAAKQWVGSNNILYNAKTDSSNQNHIMEYQDINYSNYDGDDKKNDFSKTTWGHEYNASSITYNYRNNRFLNNSAQKQSLIGFQYSTYKPTSEAIIYKPEKWLSINGDLAKSEQDKVDAISSHTNKSEYEDINAIIDENKKLDKFNYHLVQTLPFINDSSQYYKKFAFIDEVNKEFEVIKNDIYIYSTTKNADITSWFNISLNNENKLEIEAKPESLLKADFYSTTIMIKVPIRLKKDVELNDLEKYCVDKEKGIYKFPNTATRLIDNNEMKTQEVIIEAKVKPNQFLQKKSNVKAVNVNDEFEYQIIFGNKDKSGPIINAIVKDELESYLEYVAGSTTIQEFETKNCNFLNEDTSNKFECQLQGNSQKVDDGIWDIKGKSKLEKRFNAIEGGQGYVISFKVKVRDIPKLMSDKGTPLVFNEANLEGDNITNIKDDVNTPILPQPEIEKTVNTDCLKKGDIFSYTIKVGNKNQSGTWINVQLKDELMDYLQYQKETTKITNVISNDEKPVYYKVSDSYDSDSVAWDNNNLLFNVGDLKQNQYISITFNVKLIKDVKDVYNLASAIGSSESEIDDEIIGISKPIEDDVILKLIKISKVDQKEANNLIGAKLALYKKEKDKNINLLTWVSNKQTMSIYVSLNQYFIKELKAPIGYKKEDKPIFINVENNGEYEIKIINKAIPFTKTGGLVENN
ncbi:fimbrial isopeptide formation D2 family protein [Bacilli bacterium PM5-3]|nr:fimbrial isopeptide formation D2 family protein [Bacilli bacterium PM5-3]MDH6604313.1 fimbrial isopeptide formation D2 family protein [Bacilli bacterium PM5-9]